eukprot:1552247-Pleurochrysis_carterae.AAC.1
MHCFPRLLIGRAQVHSSTWHARPLVKHRLQRAFVSHATLSHSLLSSRGGRTPFFCPWYPEQMFSISLPDYRLLPLVLDAPRLLKNNATPSPLALQVGLLECSQSAPKGRIGGAAGPIHTNMSADEAADGQDAHLYDAQSTEVSVDSSAEVAAQEFEQ